LLHKVYYIYFLRGAVKMLLWKGFFIDLHITSSKQAWYGPFRVDPTKPTVRADFASNQLIKQTKGCEFQQTNSDPGTFTDS